jgi:hypothetical protein
MMFYTRTQSYPAQDRFPVAIFFGYSLSVEDPLIEIGQYGAITNQNDDGGLHFLPITIEGEMLDQIGETVFPEEIIWLPWTTELKRRCNPLQHD